MLNQLLKVHSLELLFPLLELMSLQRSVLAVRRLRRAGLLLLPARTAIVLMK